MLLAIGLLAIDGGVASVGQDSVLLPQHPVHEPDSSGGKTFYLDPVHGSMSNSGRSPQQAWRTLEEVAAANYFGYPIAAGDELILMTGNHGNVRLHKIVNGSWLTIRAGAGQFPMIQSLRGEGIVHFRFEGLNFSPSFGSFYTDQNRGMCWIGTDDLGNWSRFIRILNCRFFSTTDTSSWGPSDWADLPSTGLTVYSCSDVDIAGNAFFNVFRGVAANGRDIRIVANSIDKFSGDGIFAGGLVITVDGNLVTNCYDVSDFHNDGIQFYNGNLGSRWLTVSRNVVIADTSPDHHLSGHMQGITNFDGGGAVDSVIANNLVISNTQHGISFYSRNENCQFVNNSVYGFNSDGYGSPMRIYGHCRDTLVRNNLVTNLLADPITCTVDHNVVIFNAEYARLVFVDPARSDFDLKPGSLAIDSGSDVGAPAIDYRGTTRPQGLHVDVGAEEAH
ncbi:MAG: right-handed parallel beta-helix repeat-containing protein [Planctomycetota bacterium]